MIVSIIVIITLKIYCDMKWELFISAKLFKFLISTTHAHKLEARTNCKFHADKSFGGVGYFNALS